MKFKIGDKIQCMRDISVVDGGPKYGEVFEVTSISNYDVGFKLPRLNSTYPQGVREGTETNWGVMNFDKVKDSFVLSQRASEVNSVTIEIPTLVVVHNRDCECGAWAIKDYLHSSWCRMYKES